MIAHRKCRYNVRCWRMREAYLMSKSVFNRFFVTVWLMFPSWHFVRNQCHYAPFGTRAKGEWGNGDRVNYWSVFSVNMEDWREKLAD